MCVVVSRYSVSAGGNLWKTTLDIDDLPLLLCVVSTTSGGMAKFGCYLRWPMSKSRGLPSPVLLFGILPVWYFGGSGLIGASAFGKSCKKRSRVNLAPGVILESDSCSGPSIEAHS